MTSNRSIDFSGYSWDIKQGINLGPRNNNWSDDPRDIWVDDLGRLHMRIVKRGKIWYSTEVICREQFGYGQYLFQINHDLTQLDPHVVLGLFVYSDRNHDGVIVPASGDNEIDIEFTQWGEKNAPTNALYAIQPYENSFHRFWMNLFGTHSTHYFVWRPDSIRFQSLHGFYQYPPQEKYLIQENVIDQIDIPEPSEEKVRINFWIYQKFPANSSMEVIIHKFEFMDLENIPSYFTNESSSITPWQIYLPDHR